MQAGRTPASRPAAPPSATSRSCRRAPAQRVAADERAIGGVDAAQHPAEAELARRDPLVVVVGQPARAELHVDQDQPGLDPGHQQRFLAEGTQAPAVAGVDHCVEHRERVVGGDEDLEAQVARVAGARDRDSGPGDLRVAEVEEGQARDIRRQRLQDLARPRALDREHAVLVAHVLDFDREAADQVREVPEVRPGRRHEELVVGVAERDPVLQDEAAVVAPDGVLRPARAALPDVSGKHSCQEALGVLATDPVLEQGRGVEEPGAVADREVLVLGRHVVPERAQVPRPVGVEPGPVELAEPVMEWGGLHRRSPAPRRCRLLEWVLATLDPHWTHVQ